MTRAWLSGIVLLAVAAVGCGGSLSGGTGGSGGAGGTGSGGTTGNGGAAGGSPSQRTYTWGADQVIIYVAPTDAPRSTFYFHVQDLASQLVDVAKVSLPSASSFPATDGAFAVARYDCSSALYQVDIDSCALTSDPSPAPGCIRMTLRPEGATGEYVHTDGGTCTIESATVNMTLPIPGDGSPENDATRGSFSVACTRADGAHWQVYGGFEIALMSSVLLCAE